MAVDGTLRFDTKMDNDGFSGGVDDLISGLKGVTQSVNKLGIIIENSFSAIVKGSEVAAGAVESLDTTLDKVDGVKVTADTSDVQAAAQEVSAAVENIDSKTADIDIKVDSGSAVPEAEEAGKAAGEVAATAAEEAVKKDEPISGGVEVDAKKARKKVAPPAKKIGETVNSGIKEGMQNPFDTLKASLSKLGIVAAAAFGFKKLVDFGKQAVGLASDMDEVQNVVDTAFGSMSDKMEAFADTAIETYGISKLAAKQTGSTFMAMGRGMGIAQGAASDMAVAMTGLSADMASFYNVEQDIASTALKSVYTGETETLKQFGIVMTEANLNAYALSQGIKKSYSAMSQAEKVQLRYGFVMKQTALAQGDFARTSDGWANQTRILSEKWKEFSSIFGGVVMGVLLPVIRALNNAFSVLISYAQRAANAISNVFGLDTSPVSTQTGIIAENAADTATGYEDTAKAAKEVKKSLLGIDEINKVDDPAAGAADTGVGGIGAIATVGVDTAAAETGASKISSIFEGLGKKLEEYIKPLKNISFDNLVNAVSRLKTAVKPITKKLFKGLEWAYGNIFLPLAKWTIEEALPAFLDVLAAAVGVLDAALDALKPLAVWLWDNFLKPLAEWTGGVVVSVLEGLATALGAVGDWITGHQTAVENIAIAAGSFAAAWVLVNVAVGIWNVISAIATAATIAFNMAITLLAGPIGIATVAIGAIIAAVVLLIKNQDKVKEVALAVWDAIVGAIKKAVEGIKSAFSVVVGFFKGVWDGIKNVFSAVGKWFGDIFSGAWTKIKNAFSGVKNFFIGVWDGIKSIFGTIGETIGNGIADAFKTVVNSVITFAENTINGFIKAINTAISVINAIPGVSITKLTELSIPKLATGTVVPANFGEFAAILGDSRHPEIVSPVPDMKRAVREVLDEFGGSGGTITFVSQLIVDGKKLAEVVNKENRSSMRRNGGF